MGETPWIKTSKDPERPSPPAPLPCEGEGSQSVGLGVPGAASGVPAASNGVQGRTGTRADSKGNWVRTFGFRCLWVGLVVDGMAAALASDSWRWRGRRWAACRAWG